MDEEFQHASGMWTAGERMVMMEWVQLEMAAAKEMGCPKEPWETPPRGWLAAHPLTCRETGVYKSHMHTEFAVRFSIFLLPKCEWTATVQTAEESLQLFSRFSS